jgi:hypothetical protein
LTCCLSVISAPLEKRLGVQVTANETSRLAHTALLAYVLQEPSLCLLTEVIGPHVKPQETSRVKPGS